MATLRSLDGVVVEVLGWDEAFLAVQTDDPEAFAAEVQHRVLEATRLHCSVGIGTTSCARRSRPSSGSRRGCSG